MTELQRDGVSIADGEGEDPGVGAFAVLGGVIVSIVVIGLLDWAVEEYGLLDSIKNFVESW